MKSIITSFDSTAVLPFFMISMFLLAYGCFVLYMLGGHSTLIHLYYTTAKFYTLYVILVLSISEIVFSIVSNLLPRVNIATTVFVNNLSKRLYCSIMIYWIPALSLISTSFVIQTLLLGHLSLLVGFVVSYIYDLLVTHRPLTNFERRMDIDRFLNSCSIPGMGSEDVPLMVHFGENVPVCLPTGRTVQYSDFMQWIEGSEPHEYRNPHNEGNCYLILIDMHGKGFMLLRISLYRE